MFKIPHYSDVQIIETIQKGKRRDKTGVLNFLYRSNLEMVRKYILKNDGSEDEARDIFQESMIILFNQIEDNKFKNKSKIGTYLFAIAKNLWIAEAKRKKRADKILSNFEDTLNSETDDWLTQRSDEKRFKMLFDKLGVGCKTILTQFYYEEHSISEIRKNLSLGSNQATRNKKSRCIQKLIKIFEENGVSKDHFTFT